MIAGEEEEDTHMEVESMLPLVSRTGRDLQRYNFCGQRLVVGCIPYRYKDSTGSSELVGEEAIEVLVITAQRQGKGMLFPKGGWEIDESIENAALRETVEEAGVVGRVELKLGKWNFKSKRNDTFYEGHMFPLLVEEQLEFWPEKGSRERIWVSVGEARNVCQYWWMKEALELLVKRLNNQANESKSGRSLPHQCSSSTDHSRSLQRKLAMAPFLYHHLITAMAMILLADSSVDTFLYGGCAQIKYTPNSPYESNLNSLLASLVNSATYSAYNKFTIMGSTQQDVVNGVFQCRGDLSMPDCATCVASAVTRVGPLCPQSCGGAVQLEGCYVKYDNLSFLGVEDKTVVMKKCGPSDGFIAAEVTRRDLVLTALSNAVGAYRVGGAENVEGVAQCVGDMSVGQCQDCLSEAIRRLKQECGGASFGDMFLGKCYARYSTSGAQNYQKSNHDTHSDSEKTFAIIIGLLAGVALIIVFVAFLGRIFSRNGK